MSADPRGQSVPVASVAHLADHAKPAAAAKLLGTQLRQFRQERGLALKDVAPVIRSSVSKISRMERGESPPRDRDVLDLVRHYGVRDPQQIDEILELLRQAKASAWWQQYSDLTPGWLKRLIGLEDAAEQIYTYEFHAVPGLLQTAEYVRAVVLAALPGADEEEIRRRVEMRMKRQELLRSAQRPTVVALLDEGILHRPVGGPEVMRGQLAHLRRVAGVRGINIRIIEFAHGAHIAPSGSITHLTFPAHGPSELVYLEQMNSALYLSKGSDVDQYRLC